MTDKLNLANQGKNRSWHLIVELCCVIMVKSSKQKENRHPNHSLMKHVWKRSVLPIEIEFFSIVTRF